MRHFESFGRFGSSAGRQQGLVSALVLVMGLGVGCGGRSDVWDRPVGSAQAFGLTDAIAVSDPNADRVLLLTTDADRHLSSTAVSIQRGVRTVMVAPDRSKLFVVSEGDGDARPPAGQPAQGPALEVISRGAGAAVRYPLSEPLAGLALDPRGEWAVLYADKTSTSLVSNPNELLLVDLTKPAASGITPNPQPHTLRSFGGQPQRFTFTDVLHLPGGDRRLLIVETEQDVAILDLLRPKDPEITVQLTSGLDTRQLHPAGVVVSDGDTAIDDARIAIRLSNDPSVVVAQLVPGTGRDFVPTLNLTDVGGVPSDAAFVRTDGGVLQLAVLVPSRSKAVLINPTTNLTEDVALPAPYSAAVADHGRGRGPVRSEPHSVAGRCGDALEWWWGKRQRRRGVLGIGPYRWAALPERRDGRRHHRRHGGAGRRGDPSRIEDSRHQRRDIFSPRPQDPNVGTVSHVDERGQHHAVHGRRSGLGLSAQFDGASNG